MKIKYLSILFLLSTLISCYTTTERTIKQTISVPIYQYTTEQSAENGLIQGPPATLSSFGNIYLYKNYLLINERGQGVHIFDNSNPKSPQKVSFMNVPGNFDMAIRNDVLYVDSYDDLLSLDISDLSNIRLLQRVDNVFPQKHPSRFGIIVGYKDTVIITTEELSSGNLFLGNNNEDEIFLNDIMLSQGGGTNSPVNSVGTGGSFSRFTISNQHLYTIDNTTLTAFDITTNVPTKIKSEVLNQPGIIETLFPYKSNLFIGSTNGVFIYDISDPSNFTFTSSFTHARACDPVYVENDVAYVTLRSNNDNNCWGVNNQLDILDVEDLANPRLINTYSMTNPHGVGVDDSLLFICEANAGLKVFSLSKTLTNNNLTNVAISLLKHETSIFAYDVIPNSGNLIVVGKNELLQYDYSDPQNITFQSKIE